MRQTQEEVLRELKNAEVGQVELKDLLDKARYAVVKAPDADQVAEIISALYEFSYAYQNQQLGKPDIDQFEELCDFCRQYASAADIVRFELLCISELIRENKYKQAFDFVVDVTPKIEDMKQDDLTAKLNQLTAVLLLHEDRDKEAEPYVQMAYDYYTSSDSRYEIFKTLNLKIILTWMTGDYGQCRTYLQRALDDFDDVMTPQDVVDALCRLGNIYNRQGENEEAIKCLTRAQELSEKYKFDRTLADNYLTLGNVYMDTNNTELALDCYRKAAGIFDNINSKGGYGSAVNDIGTVYMRLKDYDKAREHFEKALGVYLQANMKRETVPLLNNLAIVCQHTLQIKKAVDYVRLSYDTVQEYGNKYELIETINVMGYMLAEDAHDRDDITIFPWLEERLEEGRKLAEEIDAKTLLLWCLRSHADVLDSKALTYMKLNDPTKAFEAQSAASTLLREENRMRNKLTGESMTKKIEEVTAKLELKLQRKESEELKKINADLKEANRRLMEQGNEMIDLERRNSALAMAVTANHEINQPLMVIQGNLELLVDSLGERNLTEKEEVYLKRLNNSVRRIQKILERYRESNQFVFDFYSNETKMVTINEKKNSGES